MFVFFIKNNNEFKWIFSLHQLLIKKIVAIYRNNILAILYYKRDVRLQLHEIAVDFRDFIKIFDIHHDAFFSFRFFLINC